MIFSTTFSLSCQIRFFHFHFQLVEKFEHVLSFQLMAIIFRFVKNVKCLIINLHKKQVVSTLALICFGRPRLGQTMKSNFSNIWDFWSRDMLNFLCFTKWFVTSFLSKFCAWFFKKNISHVIFYLLTKFHCLVFFI